MLKRKNVANLRELTRELQSYKRLITEQQQSQQQSSSSSAPLSYSSRTSSNTSLNRQDYQQQHGGDQQSNNGFGIHSRSGSSHSQQDFLPPPVANSNGSGNFQIPADEHLSSQQVFFLLRALFFQGARLTMFFFYSARSSWCPTATSW